MTGRGLHALALAARFACELGLLAALAWWGADRGGWWIAAGAGAALAAAALWGAAIAPRAGHRLPDPPRLAVELVLFALATAAFATVAGTVAAVVYAVVAVVTALAVRRWPEPRPPS